MSDLSFRANAARSSSKVDELIALLSSWADRCNTDQCLPDEYFSNWARYMIRARKERRTIFPEVVLRYPCWDILVMCFLADIEGRQMCVKQIRCEVSESNTALLRRIDELEEAGLVRRERDDIDARRTIVRITTHGRDSMLHYAGGYLPKR